MLIDDSSKIARLSATMPGMDHFLPLYALIWQQLAMMRQQFIMYGDQMYYLYGKVGFEQDCMTLEFADEKGEIIKVSNLEAHVTNPDNEGGGFAVVDDFEEFLQHQLNEYIDKQIEDKKVHIPSNFEDYVSKQKSKWVGNAIEALNYQENVHYVVHEGQIKPVDFFSTGIVQSSTVWSDGLHQFLQLKHNLKMTPETLTTNFLSNIGFVTKYNQVYGLSGTLGSEAARKVLKDVYNVELVNIPQRRKRQFMRLKTTIVAKNETLWLSEILSSIQLEIRKDRGILVICETIEQAYQISRKLKSKLRSSAVKLYTMNDMDQEENVENIAPGEVVIATNLAGRGTDIRTDEIESTGGLHVILTFLPRNKRVEDQAFGRTSRQGKRGTGTVILNAQSLFQFSDVTEIETTRDQRESLQLQNFVENELQLIQLKDKLFTKFCLFLNATLRVDIRKKTHGLIDHTFHTYVYS